MTPPPPEVLCVSLNPALDQAIEVTGLRPGEVNRATKMRITPGGKAINVASCLSDYGIPTALTGLLGMENPALFEELFRRKGIDNQCLYVDGFTRTNTKLVDSRTGETTDINLPGVQLTPRAAEELLRYLLQQIDPMLEQVRWVVLSGSLPPGMAFDADATIVRYVREAGVKVFVDTSGPALTEALAAGPNIIKPNSEELSELIGKTCASLEEVVAAGHTLLAGTEAPELVVVSMGADGAVFMNDRESLRTSPAEVHVASTFGAGDAMVAGIIAADLEGLPLEECAQLASAFAAVKLAGLGKSPEDVQALAKQIKVTRLGT
jgi:1-phosphofructokinase